MGVNCLIFAGAASSSGLTKNAGPYRIATELRKAGYTVQVVDLADTDKFDYKYKLVLKKYVDKDTLWVGFSNTFFYQIIDLKLFINPEARVYHNQHNPTHGEELRAFMSYARSLNPKVKFISGGVRTFDLTGYDFYLLRGHTDKEIVDFTNQCARDEEITKRTIINREFKDFRTSQILFQPNDVFNNELFLPIEITRGCIFRCKFCSFPLNGKKKFDHIKDYNLLREEFVRNYEMFGITNYNFSDDTYNDSVIKVRELLENVYNKLPFKIKFNTYLRLDLLMKYPEVALMMQESGLLGVVFGIETLDPQDAKLIGKGVDPQRQIEFLHKLKTDIWKDKIRMASGFILGLPNDSRKKIEYFREWLLSDNNPLDYWGVNPLYIVSADDELNQSEFNLDHKKYGYNQIFDERKHLIWENPNIDITYNEIVQHANAMANDREESKKTRHAGFLIEKAANIHGNLDLVVNNTIHDLKQLDPHHKLRKKKFKDYFVNLMNLDLP